MTAFKPGDRVLIRATVVSGPRQNDDYFVRVGIGERHDSWLVQPEAMSPAPEPPYVEPELVPGMVVMAERGGLARWLVEGDARDGWSFHETNGPDCDRSGLPERIRVVFDPLEVSP